MEGTLNLVELFLQHDLPRVDPDSYSKKDL